ncbi:MAG TPA: ADP-ribose-binding protein [Geobacter sp.]|nr:ADP-ribose-binding protein [Geobacter sp.]
MLEKDDDIWGYLGRAVIAITTSGSLTRAGKAVMGRGVARQAVQRFPGLPEELGGLLRQGGNHVHPLGDGLVSFPVEESAWACPDLRLIARSAKELRALADREGWRTVVVPRPGCGGGGLVWKEVRPLLVEHFDSRFVVVSSAAAEARNQPEKEHAT